MTEREKEVAKASLKAEKEVIEELRKQYQRALADINRKIRILQSDELTQSKIYQLQYQEVLKAQVQSVLEKLHGDEYSTIQKYLSESYTNAFICTMYAMHGQGVPLIIPVNPEDAVRAVMTDSKISGGLYKSLGVDTNNLKKSISAEITRGIASGMPLQEIARNISSATKAPFSRTKTIVRTESHRITQASTHDAQKAAKGKGADVVKQWDSTLDGDTRPTHRHLDGQIREVDKPFEADGKEAMYPGDFGDPAEDCNCRCVSLTRARWALDEDELQTLKERAEFFGLDKSEDLEDFKQKYLKAAEKVQDETEVLSAFQKAKNMEDAINAGKKMSAYGEFSVDGIHLNTVNGFNEAMFNVEQRFGRKLNISGLRRVKKLDAAYMQASYHPGNHLISLKGGNSANALSVFHKNAEKDFASGFIASKDPYGTFYHEIGHAVWTDLPATARQEITSLFKNTRHDAYLRWMELGGSSSHTSQVEVFGKTLSRYAATDEKEFFSEAFSQIMAGRMRPVSREVSAILSKYYKK